jgi:hypothetical protein
LRLKGISELVNGGRQTRVSEIIRGVSKTAAGLAGSMLVYNLESCTLNEVYEVSILSLAGYHMSALGLKDLKKEG